MKKYRWTSSNSGITLISLIITIVVALILVGVGINKIVESDLIGNTEEAVNLTNNRVQTQQGRVDELLGIYDGIVDDTQEGPGDTGGDGGGDTGGDTENNVPEFTELPYIVDNSYPSITIACVHTDADGDTVTPKLYVWKTAEDESTSVAYTAGWSGSGDGQTYSEFYLNGDLDVSTEYSYYVELSDGKATTTSEIQTFTTASMTVGTLTVDRFGIGDAELNSSYDGICAWAYITNTTGAPPTYCGTLHIWPSSSSEASATTYDMAIDTQSGDQQYLTQYYGLPLEDGIEYTYYMTFTNGTDTVTTPTKTYTPGSGESVNSAPEFVDEPYIVDNLNLIIACVHTDADGDAVTPKLYVWKSSEVESTAVAYTAGWSGSGDGETYSEFYLTGDLDPSTEYSYYVELSDGKTTTTSETQTFTTGEGDLITFVVDEVTYTSPSTYTWEQFIEDERYNTEGWVIYDDFIYESETRIKWLWSEVELMPVDIYEQVSYYYDSLLYFKLETL